MLHWLYLVLGSLTLVSCLSVEFKTFDSTKKLEYPKGLSNPLKIVPQDPLSLSVSLSDAVHHVFVTLQKDEQVATLALKSSGSLYSIDFDLKSNQLLNALKGQPGKYQLTLYAAGPLKKVDYSIGTLHFDFPMINAGKLAFESQDYYKKPDIQHHYRPEPKHPNRFLSLVFTVLVLSPWVFLIAMWGMLKLNVSLLFSNSGMFFYGTLFIAVLAGFVGLFGLYFTAFNLFQFLGVFVILGVSGFIIGHLLLVQRLSVIKSC